MKYNPLYLFLSAALLVGCDTDSDNGNVSETAVLNFSVINEHSAILNERVHDNHDKTLDDIAQANIAFNYVFLKPVASDDAGCDVTGQCEPYHITFEDEQNALRMLEIKNANGGDAASLFEGLLVKPGIYEMCLYINGEHHKGTQVDTAFDSHVIDVDGSALYLTSPSQGSCEGARPPADARPYGRLVSQPFKIERGENNLGFWFDLDHTLRFNRNHDWRFLASKDFKIVHVDYLPKHVGNLAGTVNIADIQDVCQRSRSESTVEKIYLYKGDLQLDQMLGYHTVERGIEGESRPYASVNVTSPYAENETTTHASFYFDKLEQGMYSLGYTCTAQNDSTQSLGHGFDLYSTLQHVEIERGLTTQVSFEAPFIPELLPKPTPFSQ